MEKLKITKQFLKENRTENFGWNRNQLDVLGVTWPPRKGWLKRLIGKEIDLDTADKFIKYKSKCVSKAVSPSLDTVNKSKTFKVESLDHFIKAGGIIKDYTAKKKKKTLHKNLSIDFFSSREWLELRYEVLRRYGKECMLCGAKNKTIHVDHIKPRSKFPHLAMDINNLQVLCCDCNLGKGNNYQDDWRPSN